MWPLLWGPHSIGVRGRTPTPWAAPSPSSRVARLSSPSTLPWFHLQHLQPPQGPEGPFLDAADLVLVQLSVKQKKVVQETTLPRAGASQRFDQGLR